MRIAERLALIARMSVVTIVISTTIAGCMPDPALLVDQMKEYIPEATQFIIDHDENLVLLRGVQSRTSDLYYYFFMSGTHSRAYVEQYRGDGSSRKDKIVETSIPLFEWSEFHFSESERDAILSIMATLDETNDFGAEIFLTPRGVDILYKHQLYDGRSVTLYIHSYQRVNYPSSTFHQEQVNDNWWVVINFMHRA